MTRRAFVVFLLLAAWLRLHGAPAVRERPPNFVVIFCDDMGYGDLGCFGNPTIRTPNLDRLAAEGQKWTEFYVADPVCTPSRAGLMTGRYPIRNGMTSAVRAVLFPDSANGLPESEITIAEVLKQRGYATMAIGKWHLGHRPQYLPTSQGFDAYFGIPYSNDMNFQREGAPDYYKLADDPNAMTEAKFYNVPLMEDERIVERPADQTTITRRYSQRAVDYIKANRDHPFFLYLAHNMPHIPLFASEAFRGRSRRGVYGDAVEEIDQGVGRIVRTIRDEGIADHTLVVFTSDNGPWLLFRAHGGSAGPLRAGKGTTFEGGQRVPTIFWSPGIVRPRVVTDMGSTLDLINTFAALAGAQLATDRRMDGYDLSPVLRGTGKGARTEFFYWAFARLHAVRSGPWKLHVVEREPVQYGNAIELEHPELYNVETDISEKYEVSASHPEVVARLLRMLETHRADVSDALPDQLAARIEE